MKREIVEIDIVERLRNAIGDPFEHLLEAADEIERLRGGLEHIVELYDYHVKTYDHVPSNLYLMAKIARETLEEKE